MADKLYRIKPLIWHDVWKSDKMPPEAQAETLFGNVWCYRLGEKHANKFRAMCQKGIGDFDSMEAAKAACWSWYVAKLEVALEAVPAP